MRDPILRKSRLSSRSIINGRKDLSVSTLFTLLQNNPPNTNPNILKPQLFLHVFLRFPQFRIPLFPPEPEAQDTLQI